MMVVSACSSSRCVGRVHAEKIRQALVDQGCLALRGQAPEVARNHVHEQRKLAFPVAQRLLRGHQVVDVDADAVPLEDTAAVVAHRFRAGLGPTIAAVGPALRIAHDIRDAGRECARQCLRRCVPVVRMDDAERWRSVRRGDVPERGAGGVGEPPVDVRRRSLARRAPDRSGHGVDQLPELALASPQRLLGAHLIVDVVTKAVPQHDTSALVPHRFRAARHPAIGTVGAAQAIPHGEARAGDETMAERVAERRCVIRVDDGRDHRLQSADTRPHRIRCVQPEKIDHAPVEEGRLAVRVQPPQVTRNHIDELREFVLPLAQRRLGLLLFVDVKCRAAPFDDATLTIARRPSRIAKPAVNAIRPPQTKLGVVVIAGLEAMPPPGGDAMQVIRMDELCPAELTEVVGRVERCAGAAKVGQGVRTDMGEPSGSVGRPRVAGYTLDDLQSPRCCRVACSG